MNDNFIMAFALLFLIGIGVSAVGRKIGGYIRKIFHEAKDKKK